VTLTQFSSNCKKGKENEKIRVAYSQLHGNSLVGSSLFQIAPHPGNIIYPKLKQCPNTIDQHQL
jgi:hypothetical protein